MLPVADAQHGLGELDRRREEAVAPRSRTPRPGPPDTTAVATPAMLPVPMDAPSAVMNAWKGESGPLAPACAAGTSVRSGFAEARDLHEAQADGEEEPAAQQERRSVQGPKTGVRRPDDGGAGAVRDAAASGRRAS